MVIPVSSGHVDNAEPKFVTLRAGYLTHGYHHCAHGAIALAGTVDTDSYTRGPVGGAGRTQSRLLSRGTRHVEDVTPSVVRAS